MVYVGATHRVLHLPAHANTTTTTCVKHHCLCGGIIGVEIHKDFQKSLLQSQLTFKQVLCKSRLAMELQRESGELGLGAGYGD
jgi:hypothetical protein